MTRVKKNILLLCAEAARHTATVDLHIRAFSEHSRYHVVTLDSNIAGKMQFDIEMFDAVVFHYSIVISLHQFLPEKFVEKLARFEGPKILFIQDEFRWVDRTAAAAKKLGISVVFTVVNEDVIRKIYRDEYFDNVRFELTLTGFIPEELLQRSVPEYGKRGLDIGYRARKLPGWCGSFALQKWQIGAAMAEQASARGLKCDIAMSEASRIYGDDWIKFMSNCRATLGTESGASFVDFTGQVHQEINRYEAKYPDANFEQVKDLFLEGRDGEVVIHVISPRVFEAAALRTLMIMYPGTYSGVLEAGRHFVELKPDHSNMDEVFSILDNPDKAKEIIDNAYREVACSDKWTHKTFIENFDRVLSEEFEKQVGLHEPNSPASLVNVDHEIKQAVYTMQSEAEEREAIQNAERLAEAEKHQEFKRMQEMSAVGATKVQKRMRVVYFIQQTRVAIFNFVQNKLPKPLSRPLLAIGRTVSRILKPLLKKMLL